MNVMTSDVTADSVIESAATGSKATARRDWLAIGLPAFAMLAAVAQRAWLLFSIPLVPGMNGAYYLVQVRSLILTGHLGIPDLPLVFVIQAALAKVIQFISGVPLESAILLAVKLEDSVLPALVALPVYALVRRWSARSGSGIWLPLCAAVAVAAGAPALSMVGDFQKNSLGLVWLAVLLWRLHVWLEAPNAHRASLVVLFLALAGLTHIGVFGWALILTVLTVTVGLLRGRRETLRRIWPWLFAGVAACAFVAGLVLWKFDPARVQRLASAVTHPVAFLSKGNDRPGNAPNAMRPDRMPGNDGFRPPQGGAGGPPGMGGGMPGMPHGLISRYSSGLLCGIAAAALLVVWLRRRILTTGDVALVVGCALGLLVLSGPWVTGDKVMRFTLIAVTPAVICAAFALSQIKWGPVRVPLAVLGALALFVPGVMRIARGGHTIISATAMTELQSLSENISAPDKTLIVARHGLEWWTAWFLHTHIAHMNAISAADWANYDQIFFLRQKSGMQMPGMFPGQRNAPPRNDSSFADARPPGFDRNDGPPRGFPSVMPPGGRPGMGGLMGEPMIPRDADVVHDEACFTLARVISPPRFLAGRMPGMDARSGADVP